MSYQSLAEWLDYQLGLYSEEIELGLARVRKVAVFLGILNPDFKIITVGGTNGKGSTVAIMSGILQSSGLKVGSFTSPHLVNYTERIKINAKEIIEDELIAHFAKIENARGDIKVTYFEFAALAAMLAFIKHKVDVAVLEVGLGGRLDATNIWNPEVAIVTNVALDHQKWLGDSKEKIGREKAGIFRANKLAIIGDAKPPTSLVNYARQIGADLQIYSEDFQVAKNYDKWSLICQGKEFGQYDLPALKGEFQLKNAACAVLAVTKLGFNINTVAINQGLSKAQNPGRLQIVNYHKRKFILDVAHNPDSAKALSAYLDANKIKGKTIAVFAMLKDKGISEVIKIMTGVIDEWHLIKLNTERALSLAEISTQLETVAAKTPAVYNDASAAITAIVKSTTPKDRIVVFGSFYVVGAVLKIGIDDV